MVAELAPKPDKPTQPLSTRIHYPLALDTMPSPSHPFFLLLLSLLAATAAAAAPSSLVITSCAHARYPDLCVRTLAPSAPRTPADLAVAGVSAATSAAQDAASFLRHLPATVPPAVRDCAEQLSDSGDQLARAAGELRRLHREDSRWKLDNALTWASAALTDDDTCLDAVRRLPDAAHRSVSSRVSEARRVTCNALYLVSRLAGTTQHRRR